MNLYKIWVKKCNYEEYDSWIVAAKDEEDIYRENRESKFGLQLPIDLYELGYDKDGKWTHKFVEKQKLYIKKIGETDLYSEFTYIHGSYNAG